MAERRIDLKPSDFTIGTHTDGRPIIMYRGIVPCWYTIDGSLIGYKFYISIYEDEDCTEITMICQDPSFNDMYTYGMWDSLEECKAWLENPTKLY